MTRPAAGLISSSSARVHRFPPSRRPFTHSGIPWSWINALLQHGGDWRLLACQLHRPQLAACIRCIFGLLFLNAKTREVVFEKKKQDAWFDLICRTNSLFPFLSSQRKLEETS
jgi:hypothetical protein